MVLTGELQGESVLEKALVVWKLYESVLTGANFERIHKVLHYLLIGAILSSLPWFYTVIVCTSNQQL
jgi:hypothetical protein